jgi:hypothetical protein
MNGSVTPVSGRTLRLPAAMMNAWTPMTRASPGRQDRPEVVGGSGADPQASFDHDEEQPEDGDHADEAEFLTERREREVGVDLRDRWSATDRRQPCPSPRR